LRSNDRVEFHAFGNRRQRDPDLPFLEPRPVDSAFHDRPSPEEADPPIVAPSRFSLDGVGNVQPRHRGDNEIKRAMQGVIGEMISSAPAWARTEADRDMSAATPAQSPASMDAR
jgi:hypothetical protein